MKYYRKKEAQPMEPWTENYDMQGVSISEEDQLRGSPKQGDMIAINQNNAEDRWLVSSEFFARNYEEAQP